MMDNPLSVVDPLYAAWLNGHWGNFDKKSCEFNFMGLIFTTILFIEGINNIS